jgi:hypothetical protein
MISPFPPEEERNLSELSPSGFDDLGPILSLREKNVVFQQNFRITMEG